MIKLLRDDVGVEGAGEKALGHRGQTAGPEGGRMAAAPAIVIIADSQDVMRSSRVSAHLRPLALKLCSTTYPPEACAWLDLVCGKPTHRYKMRPQRYCIILIRTLVAYSRSTLRPFTFMIILLAQRFAYPLVLAAFLPAPIVMTVHILDSRSTSNSNFMYGGSK